MTDQIPFPKENIDYKSHDIFPAFFFQILYSIFFFLTAKLYILSLRKLSKYISTYNRTFFSNQCKEIEENNRMGKTRDLLKKIRDTKGIFHAKMGIIKDRNHMD